jgi:hypothetical protein
VTKKEQKDLDKLKTIYDQREEQSKGGGRRSCPHCKSRSWWQTATQGRQCNKCWKLF